VKAFAEVALGKIILITKLESGDDFDEMKSRCKAVPGARWHGASKRWRYPLAVETCHELRKVWGSDLSVSVDLGAWYRQEAASRVEQTARAALSDEELQVLPTVAPALASALRPDQRVGVRWVAQGYRGGGLLADQPGLGKTLETIGGILEAGGGKVLVVCPKLSVKRVWQREWNRWAPDVPVYAARGTRARRQKVISAFDNDPAETKVLVVVAEMLRVVEEPDPTDYTGKKKIIVGEQFPGLFQDWDWVAVDESHKMFGSLTIAKGNLAGKGLKAISKTAKRKLAITGTPFGKGGRVQGMFGTLHWLWPDEYTSFWRWAERLFVVEDEKVYIKGGRGATKTVKRIGKLRKGGKKDFFEALGPRVLRRTKKEVLKWLPPKQYVEVLCEMEGKQLAQYKTLSDEAEVVTDGGLIMANGVLAEITRAKQVANGTLLKTPHGDVVFTGESCKIDMLMQMLEQRGIIDGDGDLKIIVASQFNEFLKAVQERLLEANVGYHIITGKTSDTQRDKAMEEFQSDGGHRVFLLNAKAGGVSVTLDAADEVHCLDELYNPEDQEQLEDRAHRASRNHQVTIYHYRSEGTIDEQIATNVEGKRQAQHAIMDGRRGLEYARELIRYRKPAE
jgi:SNF2 family DNA or RNA helicase